MIIHEREAEALETKVSARFQGNLISIDEKKKCMELYGTNQRLMEKIVKKDIICCSKCSFTENGFALNLDLCRIIMVCILSSTVVCPFLLPDELHGDSLLLVN